MCNVQVCIYYNNVQGYSTQAACYDFTMIHDIVHHCLRSGEENLAGKLALALLQVFDKVVIATFESKILWLAQSW